MARPTETVPEATQVLLDSGLLDPDYVAAQVGRSPLTPLEAVAAVLADEALSPHPLFEPGWLARRRQRLRSGLSPVSWYVGDEQVRTTLAPHPLVDPRLITERDPDAVRHPHGPLAHWLQHASEATPLPNRFLSEEITWGQWRRAAVEVARARHSTAGAPAALDHRHADPIPDLTSVVLAVGPAPRQPVEWVAALPRHGVEVLLTGTGLDRPTSVLLGALAHLLERVHLVDLTPALSGVTATNEAVSRAHGDVLVLVRPGTPAPRGPITAPLREALSRPGVAIAQPLVLATDGTIDSAGAWVPTRSSAPAPLLRGHAASDAEGLDLREISAPWSPVVAVHRRTFDILGGLSTRNGESWAEADLAVRATAEGLGVTVLTTRSRIDTDGALAPAPPPADLDLQPVDLTASLADVGLTVVDQRVTRLAVREHPPRLRWSIDTAAPAAPRGDRWGDTFFAESLASALREQGQQVAMDRREARTRATRDLDDVVLVLRGLDEVVAPRPGPVSLLWVISHPDLVTAPEVAAHDAAYAASLTWAEQVSRDWGLPVAPLLQCTDPGRFDPGRGAPDTGPEVLFVGNSRGVLRPAVRTALAAGVPLTLHGVDWSGLLPAGFRARPPVGNDALGALYASASVVLNDHHEDMRRTGFISNRIFDALACGARVLSDPVAGLDEVFGDAVPTFTSPYEMATACAAPWTAFPERPQRLALARRVQDQHSFAARAGHLVEAAAGLVARKG